MKQPKQKKVSARGIERSRTGLSKSTLKRAFAENLFYTLGKAVGVATMNDYYMALAYTVRDRMVHRWTNTRQKYLEQEDIRVVCYLSAEFLLGPHLGNNLINLGIYDEVREAVQESGLDLNRLIDQEQEPGLGNGGLGRLAACYLESLATLEIPAIGYGIHYEFGIFEQQIRNGWQVEITDKWLQLGNPWEIHRPEIAFDIKFGGQTEVYHDNEGKRRVRWNPDRLVKGVAYDTPILGYKVNTCNPLRLWKAEACESFDFQAFNVGNYYGAVDEKVTSENITKILYPNDEKLEGRQLRLEQQFFFVSCSLQDLIRVHTRKGYSLDTFHQFFSVQLNDTHPSIAIAELMRLLVDEHLMDWDKAWYITQNTFAYTNHTLLPEALEKWSLPMFRSVLPRHLEIIYEINQRFLDNIWVRYMGDKERMRRLSIIDETGEKYVRMANLACVGSQAVNGVAELHTELLKKDVLRDFYELWPEKFFNITNGVTPRRFMLLSNPRLSRLITSKIGEAWIKNLDELKRLEAFAEDQKFQKEWQNVKLENKKDLADLICQKTGIVVNPESMFDILVKRLHEYKRQHLDLFHIITLYNRLKHNPGMDITPRTFIFGGKAAPGYFMAKLIIKLINSVADVVNNDPDIGGLLKVVFLPNFNVKNAHRIYPAADLSEQISTAGKEASGTGNMKFSLNGALTIGTLDGANIEIREEVGDENFFLFGLTAEEVSDLKSKGYHPGDYYDSHAELREVVDLIRSGYFSRGDENLFRPLLDSLLHHDTYMLFADYPSYIECQEKVSEAYRDQKRWARMSILNVARMGKFSSDRCIREYCQEIWKAEPVPIDLEEYVLESED
jgi:starch phosphorylase